MVVGCDLGDAIRQGVSSEFLFSLAGGWGNAKTG